MLIGYLLCLGFLSPLNAVFSIAEPCPRVFCPPGCGLLNERGCADCSKCQDNVMFCKDKKCPPGTQCREVSVGCENVPEGAACDPMIVARCEPVCPDISCAIRCRYGLAYDKRGCQLCQCLPDPCAAAKCPPSTSCEAVPNDDCKGITVGCPPYKASCQLCKPVACKIFCPYGFDIDDAGCEICKCRQNPCLTVKCPFDDNCVVDMTAPERYRCQNPSCKPVTCKIFCPYGFDVDKSGCEICRCRQNPCLTVKCPFDGNCVVDMSLPERYRCKSHFVKSSCKPVFCEIFCLYGFDVDDSGCEICKCRQNPCLAEKCPPSTFCDVVPNDDCKAITGICPPYKTFCKPCNPVQCKIFCPYGFDVDDAGCEICKCRPNPCLTVKCPFDGKCVVDLTLPERYRCQSHFIKSCCPPPTVPQNLSTQMNVCQSCSLDCSTIKCGGTTKCCPDYFGCHGCRPSVPCVAV